MNPRTLLFDIENAPIKAWVWECYETDVIKVIDDWFMLSFAWKWLGEDKTSVRALRDYPGYYKHKKCDRSLVSDLWKLLDEADVVVAHNGDAFDLKKARTRFAAHGLKPPSPFKTVDTLKVARKEFKFSRNNLDHLAQFFGLGHKRPNTGFDMWERCIEGDPAAWDEMCKYNCHDVELLEGVYLKMRPWGKHPDLTFFTRAATCPSCQSPRIQSRGFAFTRTGKRQRIQCRDCGTWSVIGGFIKCPATTADSQKLSA